MTLEILTPTSKVFAGEIEGLNVPGSKGAFEVLNKHAALISSLDKGKIRVRYSGVETHYQIENGFIEVLNNHVVILSEHVQLLL